MDGVSGRITDTLQQTLMSLRDFISRFDLQPEYEEPHGLVVVITFNRQRLAVISITRLLMVIFNINQAE